MNAIAYIREAAAIHVAVASDAARKLKLLGRAVDGHTAPVPEGSGTANAQARLVRAARGARVDARRRVPRPAAGRIGDYERCSWYTAGTGTFLAQKGATPSIGEVGREQRVAELRVETVVPVDLLPQVVRALLEAHPYEEVAFEVYPLVDIER